MPEISIEHRHSRHSPLKNKGHGKGSVHERLTMSISQQLVRKLLKAHTSPSPEDSRKPNAANKTSNRKRKKDVMGQRQANDRVASEEDIVKWQAKIMRITDRAMSAAVNTTNKSSKSNAVAYHKVVQRREQQLSSEEQQKNNAASINTGAARSSTSTLSKPSLVKIPTFNKERYEKEQKEKRRMKLAKAFEKLNATNTTKKQKKTKKTIFG